MDEHTVVHGTVVCWVVSVFKCGKRPPRHCTMTWVATSNHMLLSGQAGWQTYHQSLTHVRRSGSVSLPGLQGPQESWFTVKGEDTVWLWVSKQMSTFVKKKWRNTHCWVITHTERVSICFFCWMKRQCDIFRQRGWGKNIVSPLEHDGSKTMLDFLFLEILN